MSSNDLCPTKDGSRDCGLFFLDIVGQYRPENLSISWTDAPYEPLDPIRRMIENTWASQMQLARQENRKLFDGPLCRLVSFDADEKQFSMTVGPVGYKDFMGTNLTQASLRYTHGPEELANPLGVSAVVATADGFLALGLRSNKVAFHAGRAHNIGGMVEPPADPARPPDPFAAMIDELRSELTVQPDQIQDIVCMGMVRDKRIVQPELVLDVQLTVDASVLRTMAAGAAESDEHQELILIANYPSTVVTFLQKHAGVLTPVATATLLLHGLRHWGSGWFTSARGYLQTVI